MASPSSVDSKLRQRDRHAHDGGEAGTLLASNDEIDIDDVFTDHIGEMGRHQRWLFVVASIPWLPGAFLTYNMAFAGALYSR